MPIKQKIVQNFLLWQVTITLKFNEQTSYNHYKYRCENGNLISGTIKTSTLIQNCSFKLKEVKK